MADTLTAHEQLRRNLVADVAHELRTPVAVLQANTEALLDGLVAHTPEQTASLHEEVLRLGRMVEDLQTLAAAEAAALQLSRQPCDLAQIAAEEAEDWDASFAAAGVSFARRLEPAPVLADPGRLHQVITNLLSNALKFTPPGGQVADEPVHGRRAGPAGGQRHRARDQPGGPGARVRPAVARRPGRPDRWQRHRPGRRGRAGPRPRGHASRWPASSASGSRFTLILPLAPDAAE